MNATSPENLLDAARAGDRSALNTLVGMHRQGVYRFGLQVCRTTEDAEDAVQETFWAATRAIHTFRGTASSITRWLFTIVRRECLRLLERPRGAAIELEEPLAADPESLLLQSRRTDLLVAALADLEPLHREVILLRDIRELSAPEAAAQLGISVDALKSRLHRARVSLREQVLRRSETY